MPSEKDVYPLRWKSVRLFPTASGDNATTITDTRKDYSFKAYVDAEIKLQRRILEGMDCDKSLVAGAIDALAKAMKSAGASKRKAEKSGDEAEKRVR